MNLAYCKGKGKGAKITFIRQTYSTFLNAYYILGTVPDAAIRMVVERVWDGKTRRTINRPHWYSVLTATFRKCTQHRDSMEEEINFFWGLGGRMFYIQDVTSDLSPIVSRN